jgi:O-antigen/teichoic acid export membrane protein
VSRVRRTASPQGPDLAPSAHGAEGRPGAFGADSRADLSRTARDGSLKLAGSALDAILGFAFVVVVSRGLGPNGAGAFFEGVALLIIATNLVKLGADTGVVRMLARSRALGRRQDIEPILWISIIPVAALGILSGAIGFALAGPLADAISRSGHTEAVAAYVRVFAPFLPISAVYLVVIAATRGLGSIRPIVIVDNLIVPGLRPLLAALALAAGLGSLAVAIVWAGAGVVGLVVATMFLVRMLHRMLHAGGGPGGAVEPTSRSSLAREFWSFSLPRAAAGLLATTGTWLDVLLLGALVSVHEAGIYAAAGRFLLAGTLALSAIVVVISPQISALLARGDRDRAEAVYRTATWWLMIPGWPTYLALATFAPVLLRIFGPSFVAGQTVLTILSTAMLFSIATGPCTAVLLMGGKSSWNLLNTAAALVTNVILNLLLIPSFGMEGAAVAWAITLSLNNLLAVLEVRVLLRMSPLARGTGIVAAGSLGCYGLLGILARAVLGATLLSLVLYVLVATSLYLGLLWCFREQLELGLLREAVTGLRRSRRGHGERRIDPRIPMSS